MCKNQLSGVFIVKDVDKVLFYHYTYRRNGNNIDSMGIDVERN